MIEVKNLVKKYGDHTAVDHLSFHVDKGQIYGFLGSERCRKINNHEHYDRLYRVHIRRSPD